MPITDEDVRPSMKALGSPHKKYLATISSQVRKQLRELNLDPALKLVPQTPWRTDTYGWTCTIAKLAGTGRCDFELWLDLFPNVGHPVLSISFWSPDKQRVLAVAKAHSAHGRSKKDFDNRDLLAPDKGNQRMRRPLPKRLFDRPLVEFYDSPFLTIYVDRPALPRTSLVDAAVEHLQSLIGAAAGALEKEPHNGDFPKVTERRLVRRHKIWERSPKIALEAKTRDGFICQVCGFNFAANYGTLGRGFAEAHHKKPLKVFRTKKVRRSAEDLITVCANCHRMLHRLRGTSADVATIKRKLGEQRS
jgi:hypothetical protein